MHLPVRTDIIFVCMPSLAELHVISRSGISGSESAVGSYRDLARSHTLLRREASIQVSSGLLFPIISASIPIIRNVSSLCCPWVYTDAKLNTVAFEICI